jgi:3-dehydroquinate synthase
VNLPEGKNLVGVVAQPRRVWIDPELLATLPERSFRAGLAEIVKAAVIADAGLFARLERGVEAVRERRPGLLERIVADSVRIKARVVERDERERGPRATLNYGHTIGHALEAAGGFRRLQHGEAVSVGMQAEAWLAERLGMLRPEERRRQGALLEALGLPVRAGGLSPAAVCSHLKADKKVRGGRVRFALPERIGRVRFPVVPDPALVRRAVAEVLS